MSDPRHWKQRLYDCYVSGGQAGDGIRSSDAYTIGTNPYLQQLIARFMPPRRSVVVADLGCGHGTLLACLKQAGYANVQGVDVSSEQIELARRNGVQEVERGEISDFLKGRENAFDVVFLMDVLEHLGKAELFALLDLVVVSLRPGGRLILHVPNAGGIFGTRVLYGDLTHENAFTLKSIRQVLHACGFAQVECSEDKPVVHGAKSFARRVLWHVLTVPFRLLLMVETGELRHVLSQNMLVVAKKMEN